MFMASSSATPQVNKYDVFLSFRGEDTCNGFISHFHEALCGRKIDTFIDDDLPRGDEISSTILNTIKESKISVIIFSKNYADSGWCLKELQQILDCRRKNGQRVIPVFFYVDPSHVRKQEGEFGAAFAKIQERLKDDDDQLQRWKAALKEAADLSGYRIDGTKNEFEFINSIVHDILGKLGNMSSIYDEDLVGAQFSIEKVKSLLQIGSNDVHIIGIWGFGGIGKTTVARVVFNQIKHQFAGSYFAQNIREEWEKSRGLGELQGKLSSLLCGKKVLIVFDDVTCFDQMEKLIGNFGRLSSGSRIIITTRDKHILENCRVDINNCRVDFYQVEVLNNGDALKLFCMNAFGQNYPPKPYEELSNEFLKYAKGLPLALKVLGRFLCGQTEDEWKSKMEMLKKTLDENIHKVLRISFDGLHKEEKDIFLDIACFFKEEKDSFVRNIFDACGFSTTSVLCRLVDLCLINILDDTITMHDLIQEMGREIVREESKNPRERSRLWDHGEICNVLEEETGGEEIQGIYLTMDEMKDIKLNRRAFSRMHNLRFFRVNNYVENRLHGFEDLESFSTKVFNWEGDGPKSLPVNFKVKDLVVFRLRYNTVERLWNCDKDLRNLTHIDLNGCQLLKKIPDLSTTANLEELNLTDCTSIEYLPDNIASKSISLSGCLKIKKAPRISYIVEKLDLSKTTIEESPFIEDGSRLVRLDLSGCYRLRSISSTILKCKSLEYLCVHGCDRLERLPEDLTNLEALKTLIASSCALREVPASIVKLKKLSSLSLSNHELRLRWIRLPNRFSDFRSLEFLGLGNCQLTKLPDDIGRLSCLRMLNLQGNKFKSIPASIKDLSNLCYLNIQSCERLVSLPELPGGTVVAAMSCLSLESISPIPSPALRPQRFNLSKCFKLNLSGILNKESGRNLFQGVCYSGNQIPKWFDFKGNGTQMLGTFEEDCIKENVIGFNMCAVVEIGKKCFAPDALRIPCSYNITGRIIIENEAYKCPLHWESRCSWFLPVGNGSSDYVFMDFVPISIKDIGHRTKYNEKSTESNNSHVAVRFLCDHLENKQCGIPFCDHIEIKQFGIHFVYGSDSECGDSRAIDDFILDERQTEKFWSTTTTGSRAALEEAAGLSGHHIAHTEPESEITEFVANDISNRLRNTASIYDKYLVGAKSRIEGVKSLLQNRPNDLHIIGIWGPGGIGKTTIARAVFNEISHQFEGFFFAANIREEWERSHELTHLQDKLFTAIEKHYLYCRKVLIIFDDVTCFEQIEKLIKNFDRLCLGSRIIVTTRYKHIFENRRVAVTNCGVDVYEVERLNNDDALQLFCENAFRQDYPPPNYVMLSNVVLRYAKGLPLALKVLGQFLYGKTKKEWRSKMEKLEKTSIPDIQEVLKISYDGLGEEEKNIFLDIACFFKEEASSFVIKILDAFGFSVRSGLRHLIKKCLITVVDDTITMHDLLQKMGREIVQEQSKDRSKQSRLWNHEEIYNVLKQDEGGEEIQGIWLNMSNIKDIKLDPYAFSRMRSLRFFGVYDTRFGFSKKKMFPRFAAFKGENKLLGFEELQYFSTKVFYWQNYKLKSLPSNFQVKELVILVMHGSRLERLWNGYPDLANLKHIDLTSSLYLEEIPDLSTAKNLKELILRNCASLEHLPDNIPSKSITLSGCSELKKAPMISCIVKELDLGGTAIKKLPSIEDESRLVRLDLSNCLSLKSLSSTICKCKFLEYLSVDGCLKLKRLPEDLGNLEAVETFVARGTGLRELPSNILKFSELCSLSLSRRRKGRRLNQFPNDISSLRSLESLGLANCQLAKLPDDFGQLSSLRLLNLLGNEFESIPASIKDLSNLCYLNIRDCKRLVSLPELPRGIVVNAFNCLSLESISELPLQASPTSRPQRLNLAKCSKLDLSKNLDKESGRKIFSSVCYRGNEIPEWFDFKEEGTRMRLEVEEDCIKENVLGFIMCVVVEVVEGVVVEGEFGLKIRCSYNIPCRVIIENEVSTRTGESYCYWPLMAYNGGSDYVLMDFVPISNKHIPGTKHNEKSTESKNSCVDVTFYLVGFYLNGPDHLKIKRCGIHFVYGSECGDSLAISDFMIAEEQSIGHRNICPKDNRKSKYLMFGLDPNVESSDEERDEEEESSDEQRDEEEESSDEQRDEEEESSDEECDEEEPEISDSSGKSSYTSDSSGKSSYPKRRRLY